MSMSRLKRREENEISVISFFCLLDFELRKAAALHYTVEKLEMFSLTQAIDRYCSHLKLRTIPQSNPTLGNFLESSHG
jgi:hypothetical protein